MLMIVGFGVYLCPPALSIFLHQCSLNRTWLYLGVVNRRGQTKVRFVAFVALIKCFEAKLDAFSPSFDIFKCWKFAKMPRCRDLVNLVLSMTDKPIPCACVQGSSELGLTCLYSGTSELRTLQEHAEIGRCPSWGVHPAMLRPFPVVVRHMLSTPCLRGLDSQKNV